jgi:hypothetical protein
LPKPNIAFMQQMAKIKLRASPAHLRNSQRTEIYIDKVCQAIGFAWDMWRMQAKFKDLRIHGPVALGPPGCLDGPLWEGLIKSQMLQEKDAERALSDAIASVFSDAWKRYQDSVMVPGLPWYPGFSAWAGPMAPPTPNVPTPLIALVQNMQLLAPVTLKANIIAKAGKSNALADQVADALTYGFYQTFMIWVATQQIVNVLGKGPVPSFAPPYVPVGPVVGGDNIATPGHLMT